MVSDDLTTTCEELLRAIGLLLDEEGLRNVRIWAHDGGVIVQGCLIGESAVRTLDLTHDDVRDLVQAARDRRRQAEPIE